MKPNLFDTLETQPGVGVLRYKILNKLGLHRIMDAIFFFPRSYEDHSEIKAIGELQDGESASVIGDVHDFELVQKGGGKSSFYLLVKQDNQFLRAIWFNQPFRANRVAIGQRVMISGKVDLKGLRFESVHPKMTLIENGEDPVQGSLLPVYKLTEGIKQAELRRLIRGIVEEYVEHVEEILPLDFRKRKSITDIKTALQKIHFPSTKDDIELSRNRFVYQELLTLQLAVRLRKLQVAEAESAPPLVCDSLIDSKIKSYFPFQLTSSQQKAISEISTDMAKAIPMNRMLHGDVGCGKTIVATYALMLAVANNSQGVLMAPTETLARQHYRTLQTMLVRTRVQIGLLTGTISPSERTSLLADIKSGAVNIIVGTQSLIQNEIEFSNLGIVIVDEQHRFGVKQRAGLKQQNVTPHYLVMTATPIPRTLSMTMFGDLDVSVVDELPPNRIPVKTYLCDPEQQPKWWEFVRKKLREGRQAFVIAPLVEEDERGAWASVEETYESLANGELADFKIDLLHGRQSPAEKDQSMQRFSEGATQVLIATSVVEVGIDVPNATIMTILSASRFGLSQLHQLRGRVGRGKHAGYVTLFDPSGSEEARQRLTALAETNDGFELAEVDFRLRGPGDLFGTKQHGMPPLFVADLIRDYELLVQARNDAQEILETDTGLDSEEFSSIRQRVFARYGSSLELSDVG